MLLQFLRGYALCSLDTKRPEIRSSTVHIPLSMFSQNTSAQLREETREHSERMLESSVGLSSIGRSNDANHHK